RLRRPGARDGRAGDGPARDRTANAGWPRVGITYVGPNFSSAMGREDPMRQVAVKMSVALALVAAGYAIGRAQTSFSSVSGVVPAELAKVTETGPWGQFHTYVDSGTTATAA